jgi:hypothetical protein
MFTLEQIKQAHDKVQTDFPNYIQDLINLGVRGYDTLLTTGMLLIMTAMTIPSALIKIR